MDDAKERTILGALDMLALALTNTDHIWTYEERELYEEAVALLNE